MYYFIQKHNCILKRRRITTGRIDLFKHVKPSRLFLVVISFALIIILTRIDTISYYYKYSVSALVPVSIPKSDVLQRSLDSRRGLHLFGKNDFDGSNPVPVATLDEKGTLETPDGTTFGNLVLQMQKKEQAALKASGSKGLKMKDQVLELDPIPGHHHLPVGTASNGIGGSFERSKKDRKKEESSIRAMDIETARDLDEAVTFPTGSREELTQNMLVLPLNPLYTTSEASLLPTNTSNKTNIDAKQKRGLFSSSKRFIRSKVIQTQAFMEANADLPFLSRPEHYLDRIGRDKRHLAVSIAASIDSVDQWRLFSRERGGIYPILETIREGARVIEAQEQANLQPKAVTTTQMTSIYDEFATPAVRSDLNGLTGRSDGMLASARGDYLEETFQMACLACRSVRDLCAISPELAAVITDSILRANAAWDGGVMHDFRTLLRHSSDYTAEKNKGESSSKSMSQKKGAKARNTLTALDTTRFLLRRRLRRDARFRCKLYVTQLLLAMTVASDDAVTAIRETEGLSDTILGCSSFALKEQTRRWIRYPVEMIKSMWRKHRQGLMTRIASNLNVTNKQFQEENTRTEQSFRRPFLEAGTVANDMNGSVQRISNQLLAAIGYNKWIPKMPGQRGLRILSLDGGGSRGMAAVTAVNHIIEQIGGGAEVADSFDMIVGTSTGGIISFLIGLRRETTARALTRYQQLISKIFIKSALSTPLMLFTTATYDESHFMSILSTILQEKSMLDSRADPAVPLVCCLTSKMSSTPTHVALFRNYNYASGELADPFTINPDKAREDLDIPLEIEHETIRNNKYSRKVAPMGSPGVRMTSGSRHPGSFRVLQRYALRASTAAPTVFKPVMMGGEMYCDGGIVSSNPTAVAIHEARAVFPDVPIELVVSVGTGNFLEEKSAPRIGWDGIIGQIVNSATDAEQVHHILEDIFGSGSFLGGANDRSSAVSKLQYFRFNPTIGRPDEFPIDVTDPEKLAKLRRITIDYLREPEQEKKIEKIGAILNGRQSWLSRFAML